MAPQSNDDSVSFKSRVWLLFTRAHEVKESGGQHAAAVWKAERRWACSGFVACPGSRFFHLPLGQKLKKSPVTYPRAMLLVFTPVCFPNLLRVWFSFLFTAKSAHVLGHVCVRRLLEDPRVVTPQGQTAHWLPAHVVLKPVRGPPSLSPLSGSSGDHLGAAVLPFGAGPLRLIHLWEQIHWTLGLCACLLAFLHLHRASQVPTGSPDGPHSRLPRCPTPTRTPAPWPHSELTTQYPPLSLFWAAVVCFHLAPQTAITKWEEIGSVFFTAAISSAIRAHHSMKIHFCRAKTPLCLPHFPLVFYYLFFLFSHKHKLLFESTKDKSISLSLIISFGRAPHALWSEFFTMFRLSFEHVIKTCTWKDLPSSTTG